MTRNSILSFVSFIALCFQAACSYQPDDPGQCKLVCSNAVIAGNDEKGDGLQVMKILNKGALPATTCEAAAAGMAVGTYRSVFVVGEALLDQTGKEVGFRPTPYISIEPLLVGGRANVQNGETNPAYQGIMTPRSNWCSDSCGVVSLDTVPTCPPPGMNTEYSVKVHSGALFSEPANYSISTKDLEAAN